MTKEMDKARDQHMVDMHAEFLAETRETRESFRRQLEDLRKNFQQQLTDLKVLLDERYSSQTEAISTAFKSAELAVNTALTNAEKAVTKAEVAAEERFKSVNEFRAQLGDQAATFLTRTEYDTAHTNLVQRFESESKRLADRFSDLEQNENRIHQEMQKPHEEIMRAVTALDAKTSSRLDLLAGQSMGDQDTQARIRAEAVDAQNKSNAEANKRIATMGIVISIIVVLINVIFFVIVNLL
jgi:hypothetical protein